MSGGQESAYPTEDLMDVEAQLPREQSVEETDHVTLPNGTQFEVAKGSSSETVERLKMEVDEQDRLLRELATVLDQCRAENIPNAFGQFAFALHQFQQKHGPFKSLGYAGLKALPLALGALFANLQGDLPEECQTQEWQDSELCAGVIRRLKAKWANSPMAVLLYSEMLIPGSLMVQNATVLRQQEYEWVREAARLNIQQAAEEATEGKSLNPATLVLVDHWERLSHGGLPLGFNSEFEHRYSTLDIDLLLGHDLPDPTDELKKLSQHQVAYLDRIAREQLEAVESGQISRSPEQVQHLHLIANHQYPHGFRAQE